MIKPRRTKSFLAAIFVWSLICCSPLPLPAQDNKDAEVALLAKRAFDDGFYDLSLSLFERALSQQPDAPRRSEINLFIARCYLNQNKPLEARKKLEEIIILGGNNGTAYYWLAETYFRGNDFRQAAVYYRKAIDTPQSSYASYAYYSLGACLEETGDYRGALEYFKAVKEKFSGLEFNQDTDFKIISCLYNLKEFPGLKESAQAYLKAYPEDSSRLALLYFYMAESDYYLDNITLAADEYERAISSAVESRQTALFRLSLAWADIKLKKYKEADDLFEQIDQTLLDSDNRSVFLLGKGFLLAENRKFSDSLSVYDEIISSTQYNNILLQAYLGKADSLFNLSRYGDAAAIYKETLYRVNVFNFGSEYLGRLHYGLGEVFIKQGKFTEALDEFRKAVDTAKGPDIKAASLCRIADIYSLRDSAEKAAGAYRLILKSYPDSGYADYARYQLGLSLFKLSKYDEALVTLHDFKADFKDSVFRKDALYLMGLALYKQAKFKEAQEIFYIARNDYIQDKEFIERLEYEIALCCYQKGEHEKAVDYFNRVLSGGSLNAEMAAQAVSALADILIKQEKYDLAEKAYKNTLAQYKNLKSVLYPNLGELYILQSRFSEALEYMRSSLDVVPRREKSALQFRIAECLQEQAKISEALDEYLKVTYLYPEDDPFFAKALLRIAQIYEDKEMLQEAKDIYKRIIDLNIKEAGYASDRLAALGK